MLKSFTERTKKVDVSKYYCDSDLVIKGRFIVRNPWPFNHIKVFALDSFKEPFVQNKSYNVIYKNEDRHGCYHHYNFIKDYFYFATSYTTNKDVFTVTAAIADDGSREAAYLKAALPKYKNKDLLCQPPLPPE
ncbi:Hypothetical predicted protein [Paramuricea clavata]|uniref:Uncharacterized protein n=1 Tax=Paramuricea clavata TaxID=317549 RepID=A0A6S7G2E3_PARCT|nr:Hypothetical predicted protein [Paramuricea clavata]